MSRKRRNLLSKKLKSGKRNTKRNTKTRKNIRKMRGGADIPILCGGILISIGTTFKVNSNEKGVNNINIGGKYNVISIIKDKDDENNPRFELELIIHLEFGVAHVDNVVIPFNALNTCRLAVVD